MFWRGERKCIDPKAGGADLWIKIWEELHLLKSKKMLVEVEHVQAHRSKNDKKEMSQFEKYVAEGNQIADELAEAGAGLMAAASAKDNAAVCSQASLLDGGVERL